MKSRYGFDEAKIARFHKEGRGQGYGAAYTPWLMLRDVPSTGRSHRMRGLVTGRVHHLLSDIERGAFLIYDFRDDVCDIREQFPLDVEESCSIAEQAGIRHPVDSKTRVALVQTTHLLIDLEHDGRLVTVARAIKPSSELGKPRAIEKLEIERRYWAARGVDWRIVTERDSPPNLLRNLEFLQGCASLEDLVQPYDGFHQEKSALLAAELGRNNKLNLQEFCLEMDGRLGLETGGSLFLIRHLLAVKTWRTDMMRPITDETPLSAFHNASGPVARRRPA